jgi:DNA helicase-2/ATP-dependent DNA helicase PcrA
MANAKASVAHRLSAAAALNEVGARPREWWGRRDWTDPGDPLYGGEIRTSYSRLSTLENCALQYLYQVELGLDDEETFQMWVGSAVHGIIDRVQRGELARDLPALHQALDDAWRPDIFPNRAIEHRRYLDARAMLARWVEHEQADAIASERWFEFPLDGAVIRGRIDAIFRMNNGHLRVVDYKTSRYPISEEEAKKDLQLAAYYLAMKRTPELAELGEPGYLQLDYLGKPSQSEGFARRGVSPKQEPGYEERATEAITSLVARIRAEEFGFNPEADCTFCSFRTICGRYPEGREAPVDATASRAGAPAVGAR